MGEISCFTCGTYESNGSAVAVPTIWRDQFDVRRIGVTDSSLGRLDVKTIRQKY